MATTNIPKLPLVVANDVEPLKTWEGITTPNDLALYLARLFSVDVSQITRLEEFISSPIEPIGEDRRKVWIKTEGAPAIGIPIGGSYQLFYQYPAYVPFIWTQATVPNYFRELTTAEMEDMSLTAPANNQYKYVIFEP